MVRHDVAVAGVLVVAVVLLDQLARACASPACSACQPRTSAITPGDQAVGGDQRRAGVEEVVDVGATKASASIAAQSMAAWTASPSWLTLAGRRASRRPAAGSPGATMAQPSMKICAPICSATVAAVGRDRAARGAGMPRLRLS